MSVNWVGRQCLASAQPLASCWYWPMMSILPRGVHADLWCPYCPVMSMLTCDVHTALWCPCWPVMSMLTCGVHADLWCPYCPVVSMLTYDVHTALWCPCWWSRLCANSLCYYLLNTHGVQHTTTDSEHIKTRKNNKMSLSHRDLHCVSKKGYHPTTNDNFNNSCPIPVIFGTNIA